MVEAMAAAPAPTARPAPEADRRGDEAQQRYDGGGGARVAGARGSGGTGLPAARESPQFSGTQATVGGELAAGEQVVPGGGGGAGRVGVSGGGGSPPLAPAPVPLAPTSAAPVPMPAPVPAPAPGPAPEPAPVGVGPHGDAAATLPAAPIEQLIC